MNPQDIAKKWFDTCFRHCFGNKYNIFVEKYNGKNYRNNQIQKVNNLPIGCGSKYNPDVILEDKNGKIRYIIEIEGGGDTVLKGIPGAVLLADYCVAKQQPREKFNMLFIACSENDIKKIQVRVDATKSYCHWKNLDKVEVCDYDDFIGNPMEKLNELFS